jgi:hypothetical protein
MPFNAIWTFIEMTLMICGFCLLWGEIVKFYILKKAEEEARALHSVNEQIRHEAHRCGLYFKKEHGGFYLYHTNESLLENKMLREENRKLKKDNDLYEHQFTAMCKWASRNGYKFDFEKGKCLGMTLKKA